MTVREMLELATVDCTPQKAQYTVVNGRVIVDQGRLVNAVAVGTEPGAELQGAAPSVAAAGRISSAARRQTPRH
jgi:hypothetical protein